MTGPIRNSTIQTTQTSHTQEAAPKQKEIDRKSSLVGSEKMYKVSETAVDTLSSAGRATVGFFKSVAAKVGLARDKATDTIGQKPNLQNTQANERASRAEARKSQNGFISFIDKLANLDEALDDPNKTREQKLSAFKDFKEAFQKLPPREQRAYASEMNRVMRSLSENSGDKKIDNIMNEILQTENSYLTSLKKVYDGLSSLEGKIPKEDLNRMKEEYGTLVEEATKSVELLKNAQENNHSDIEKLLLIKERFNLNSDTANGRAIAGATINYTKNLQILKKSGSNIVDRDLITPVQRGPRYVLFMADLAKSHSDPIFKETAAEVKMQISGNIEKTNANIPKEEPSKKK